MVVVGGGVVCVVICVVICVVVCAGVRIGVLVVIAFVVIAVVAIAVVVVGTGAIVVALAHTVASLPYIVLLPYASLLLPTTPPLQKGLHPLHPLLPASSSTDPTVRPDARAPVDGLPQLWLPLLGHLHSHVEVLE